jgi:hypothetical protein
MKFIQRTKRQKTSVGNEENDLSNEPNSNADKASHPQHFPNISERDPTLLSSQTRSSQQPAASSFEERVLSESGIAESSSQDAKLFSQNKSNDYRKIYVIIFHDHVPFIKIGCTTQNIEQLLHR